MSSSISINAADILEEVIQKDPTISSNTVRLEAATEYINRIRQVVEDVESVIRKSITTLTDPSMCALRDKFAKSVMKNMDTIEMKEMISVEKKTTHYPSASMSTNEYPMSIKEIENSRAKDDEVFEKVQGGWKHGHMSIKEIENSRAKDDEVFEKVQGGWKHGHGRSFLEPTFIGARSTRRPGLQLTIEHIGSEIDTNVLFDGAKKELRKAFSDIETRFLQDVIESITKDVKYAKINVIASMFPERSTVDV